MTSSFLGAFVFRRRRCALFLCHWLDVSLPDPVADSWLVIGLIEMLPVTGPCELVHVICPCRFGLGRAGRSALFHSTCPGSPSCCPSSSGSDSESSSPRPPPVSLSMTPSGGVSGSRVYRTTTWSITFSGGVLFTMMTCAPSPAPASHSSTCLENRSTKRMSANSVLAAALLTVKCSSCVSAPLLADIG